MNGRLLLAAIFIPLTVAVAAAQNGFNVRGEVRDGAFPNQPRFDDPLVSVFVKPATTSDRVISSWNLALQRQRGAFLFSKFIGDSAITNQWAIITVQAGEHGDFVVPDPSTSRAELTPNLAGEPIDFAITLRHRSEIAEGYRRSVFNALRSPNVTPDLLEGANNAALSAVEMDPTINNLLLVARVTDAAIRRDMQDVSGVVLDPEMLNLNDGFEALSLDDRWMVRLRFLDTLSRSDSTRAQAIATGTAMIDSLPLDDDEALARLRIVHVFLTMSRLWADEGDCMSLARNAEQAIALADRLRMDWNSRRTLLLGWADCLERLSGAGNGRTADAYIAEAAGNTTLRKLWSDFADSSASAYDVVALSTVETDRRLLALVDQARAIRDHQ